MSCWSGFPEEMMKDHIHLNFFREYQDCLPQLQDEGQDYRGVSHKRRRPCKDSLCDDA